jgi:hypothetical protein
VFTLAGEKQSVVIGRFPGEREKNPDRTTGAMKNNNNLGFCQGIPEQQTKTIPGKSAKPFGRFPGGRQSP